MVATSVASNGIGAGDRFLKVGEVQAILGVCEATVYRLMWRGELLAVKVNGARRIPMSAVNSYIAARIAEAEAQRAS